MVAAEKSTFTIKMWALLDTDNKTVLGCYTPDIPYEKVLEDANGRTLIEMTLENSPAYINGTYENEKFYPPVEGRKE
jgi:hypothetical protein